MTGTLAGTGKMVILPVDQGFEHGPQRSFAPNPPGYDPDYHVTLAVESGCNAYAAPLGFLEAIAGKFAGEIPLILKLNNSDSLSKMEPASALTASPRTLSASAAPRSASPSTPALPRETSSLRSCARSSPKPRNSGLPTVVWAYPRGGGIPKEAEQAVDVVAYGAQISAQIGAHVIKVKPPKETVFQPEAKAVFEKYNLPSTPWPTGSATSSTPASPAGASASSRVERQRTRPPSSTRSGASEGRRLRLHHGPQCLPAPEGRSHQAAEGRDGHPRQQVSPAAGGSPEVLEPR